MMTTLEKSSRHPKITGDMGEALVCYLLSKAGWEIGRFDHTGIDLIASRNGERLGISVKSRSRYEQRNSAAINLPRKNIEHTNVACTAFGLKPAYAFVCDREGKGIVVYLMSDKVVQEVCAGTNADRAMPAFPMTSKHEAAFRARLDIEWCDLAALQCSPAFRALPVLIGSDGDDPVVLAESAETTTSPAKTQEVLGPDGNPARWNWSEGELFIIDEDGKEERLGEIPEEAKRWHEEHKKKYNIT